MTESVCAECRLGNTTIITAFEKIVLRPIETIKSADILFLKCLFLKKTTMTSIQCEELIER